MNDYFYIRFFDPEINTVVEKPLEEMTKILLPSQIDINFHIECLKAQAVILRTNLVKKSLKMSGKGCSRYKKVDLCKSEHCYDFCYIKELKKVWGSDFNCNMEKLEKVVKDTEGLIITFKGNPIIAKYHDTCGGSTENSENVIKNEVVYLRKVLCDYCVNSPNFVENKDFLIDDLEKELKINFPIEDPFSRGETDGFIEKIIRDEEGRVVSITVGNREFSGKDLMKFLKLNSTRFYITPLSIRITSIGKGDGLGFCQHGGNEMAKRGYSFEEILNYYYTGIKVEKYPLPCIKKPLFGKIIMIDPAHGGEDFGYVGSLGVKEKEVVLKLSKEIKEELESIGAKVYLTRKKDEEVLLVKRADMANSIRPDFFISFHMNYFSKSNAKGCEIYHFREDLESERMGKLILKNLKEEMDIVDRGVKESNFYLLKNVGVNSILIEIGFLSNEDEEKNFLQENYIKRVAKVISAGILEYFQY